MKIIKRLFRTCKRIYDTKVGSLFDTLYWKFRGGKWAISLLKDDSLKHPRRTFVLNYIKNNPIFDSFLEVGCGSGPNIFNFARENINTNCLGIELNHTAVQTAIKYAQCKGIFNVKFQVGNILYGIDLPDKSVDFCLSDAFLLNIHPKNIVFILGEIFRVTKKKIILCEMHNYKNQSTMYHDHWIYNWKYIIESQFLNKYYSLEVIKIPAEMCEGLWNEYGYVIGINLAPNENK